MREAAQAGTARHDGRRAMTRAGRFGSVTETALTLALGMAAIYAALLPYSLSADRLPAPDLVYCLIAAWTIRRPSAAPLWAILLLGLAGDVLTSRPPGLGALGLLLGAEALRANAGFLRSGPFVAEWLAVAAVFAAMLVAMSVALHVAFLDGPGAGPLLGHAVVTALAYPFVAALLNWGVGMRAPRRPAGDDRLGRIK